MDWENAQHMIFGKTGAPLPGLSSEKALSLSEVAHTWGLLTPEQATGASGVRDLPPTSNVGRVRCWPIYSHKLPR